MNSTMMLALQPTASPVFCSVCKKILLDEVDSTNSWALRNTDQWMPNGLTVVMALSQTAGRGRFKRRWISPPDLNLYASLCFGFDAQRGDVGHLPQLLALATVCYLEQQGLSPVIKWPNDILLSGKKIAGILCETASFIPLRGIVCGIGLNVNTPQEVLREIDRPATSLLVESGYLWNKESILEEITSLFTLFLQGFIQEGFSPYFSLFRERLAVKRGESITFHDNHRRIQALFEALHPDGSVELRLPDGTCKVYYAGEFVLSENGGACFDQKKRNEGA